jgi:YD repeat-containing protein
VAYTYDLMLRQIGVCYPDGGYTQTSYPSAAEQIVAVLLSAGAGCVPGSGVPSGTWATSTTQFDGYGRVIHSTDPAGNTLDTSYDEMGRVYSVSNPHPAGSGTSGTVYYGYDTLGRLTSLENQDGFYQYYCYDGQTSAGQPAGVCQAHLGASTNTGTWVDFQDENKNQWQRTQDSFGRLTEVMEPNGASQKATMETDYGYDVLNNLLSVTQWGGASGSSGARRRSFSYDSLSRLVCASNPENSFAACPASGSSSYISGTTGYSYDSNSNVASKTDARGVTTSYTYDNLNRLLSKTYSDGTTPSSCYHYDSSPPTNGIGRLVNALTLSASAGTCSLPTAGPLTQRSILKYDPMGRVKSEQQFTPSTFAKSTSYPMAYTYDFAGNLTSSTSGAAPSQMTLTSPPVPCSNAPSFPATFGFVYCYDSARRLQSVTTNAGSGPTGLFTAQGYAPLGGLTNATYGSNAVSLSRFYDKQLRITSERDLGNSPGSPTSGATTVTITGEEQTN